MPIPSTGSSREQKLLFGITKDMQGVEIGPFYNPLTPKADGWNTVVVDFADTAHIRQVARTHNEPAVRDLAHKMEEVDLVWRSEPFDELLLQGRHDRFDFIVASHAIEHVPDIISFLQQASKVLKPSGVLILAIPDMRLCFDAWKPFSTSADALRAYREQRTRHDPEIVLLTQAYPVTTAESGSSWAPGTAPELIPIGRLKTAYEQYQSLLSGGSQEYIDCHAWFFTPSSFELIMLELGFLGLIDLQVEWSSPSTSSEFLAHVRPGRMLLTENEMEVSRRELIRRAAAERLQAI